MFKPSELMTIKQNYTLRASALISQQSLFKKIFKLISNHSKANNECLEAARRQEIQEFESDMISIMSCCVNSSGWEHASCDPKFTVKVQELVDAIMTIPTTFLAVEIMKQACVSICVECPPAFRANELELMSALTLLDLEPYELACLSFAQESIEIVSTRRKEFTVDNSIRGGLADIFNLILASSAIQERLAHISAQEISAVTMNPVGALDENSLRL